MTPKDRPALFHWAPIVLALVSLVSSAFIGYTHNDKAIDHRITTVEVQQINDKDTVKRLEAKIDALDSKIDRLVTWALGK